MLSAKILKKIKPSAREECLIAGIANRLHEIAAELGHDAVVCGSTGKLTWLRGDHDIDLFVLFDKNMPREYLEKAGLAAGKKMASILKGSSSVKYAEHPYTRIKARFHGEEFKIDVVPCYKIIPGEKIISAVDRSPHHLSYVLKKLKDWQRDEVRLLKQFMKGVGVYGSDAKNSGFSGYVCEILILKYGSFEKTLKAVKDWHAPQMLDDTKKFSDPLVITDPVDDARNAAASISAENFERFVMSAKRFLERPGADFFTDKKATLSKSEARKLMARGTFFAGVKIRKPDVIDDILYPQLRRAIKRMDGLLISGEFYPLRSFECVNEEKGFALAVFELETWEMPAIKKMVGPPVFSKKHSSEFLSKYHSPLYGPYIEGDRWVADKNREFTKASELLKNLLKKGCSQLVANGIPENIAREFGNAKLLYGDDFWKIAKKERVVSACLRKKYFERLI